MVSKNEFRQYSPIDVKFLSNENVLNCDDKKKRKPKIRWNIAYFDDNYWANAIKRNKNCAGL